MEKIGSYLRLLALFSAFFIYKAIMGAIEIKPNEVILWSLITIIYIVSLIIVYFVMKRWKDQKNIN